MTDLLKPEIRVETDESNYAHIVAEPLEKGFGTTLGNSLRRVLLSSLSGAAITSVRIEGVDHEFSTIEGMKEDVTEFLLNLKEVRLRAFSDRPARLLLEVGGAGEITAGQIETTADYEIVNPDLVLASLDTDEASLMVDLNVETGRGYVSAGESEGLPIGVIPVDAIFTPVRRTNFNVSKTRVGQDTTYDRVDMEIWTDGTVDGPQALSAASEILREQLSGFMSLGIEVVEVEEIEEEVPPSVGHDVTIEQLQLSVRAYNCLKRSGLLTVAAVLEKSEEESLALRNFGDKSYQELKNKLVSAGFSAPRTDLAIEGLVDDSFSTSSVVEPPTPSTAAADADSEDEDVGALGAALMEALKEAGRESS